MQKNMDYRRILPELPRCLCSCL